MADEQLSHVRTEFVKRATTAGIKQLLDGLLEDRVINAEEKDDMIEANNTTADKARILIDTVLKKGPMACEKLISLLKKRDPHLYNQLELAPPESPTAAASLVLLPCTKQFKWDLLKEKAVDIYDMMPKGPQRRRQALLINNIQFDNPCMLRRGAEKDEENMEKLLKGLEYTVDKHSNLSAQAIEEAVKSFSKREEHWQSDSAFLVIMSHGKMDVICGVHYDTNKHEKDLFSINNIFKYLNNQNCPALRNKPKVIVIQACRVEGKDESGMSAQCDSAPNPSGLEDDGTRMRIPPANEKDFICLMSCTPDTLSYRDKEAGTFFIQKLVETINTHAHKDDFQELFQKVMKQFSDPKLNMQMPSADRLTLIKKFYLFPGQ